MKNRKIKDVRVPRNENINPNEYIGFGVPSLEIYLIQPSNLLPILDDDFSIDDSRSNSIQILDNHLYRYKKVWQALS